MSPKLYDEVSTKLAAIWGDYAGWAHSVSDLYFVGSDINELIVHKGALYFRPEIIFKLWFWIVYSLHPRVLRWRINSAGRLSQHICFCAVIEETETRPNKVLREDRHHYGD